MPRRNDFPCADCGLLMQRGWSTLPAGQARCNPCRKVDPVHGTSRYRKYGCRCDICTAAVRDQMRAYVSRVKAREGVTPTQKIRGVVLPKPCSVCGTDIQRTFLESPMCSSCRCRSRRGINIAADMRLAIYILDGWICQICNEAIDQTAHHNTAWAPTLDHVIPRSHGGSDDPSNLRTAHRYCNSVRGNRSGLTIDELAR